MNKKCKLLEWVTAEDGENKAKTDLNSYYNEMSINLFLGIVFLFLPNIFAKILGVLWIVGPIVAWYISLEKRKKEHDF